MMCTMPKPYPKEFREDLIRVARDREPGVHLKQIDADFGVSESCRNNRLAKAIGRTACGWATPNCRRPDVS
jgi:hypothetical protein